ncbi:MAG: xanthine dehydrogenase family protein subunit M [Pseudomonadota bacterium]
MTIASSACDVYDCQNLSDALQCLDQNIGKWKILAGGTDLMVLMETGQLPQGDILNIWGIPEISQIEVTKNEVILGALTTYSEIIDHPLLQKEFPMLVAAAKLTGSVAIQNRGTLGGNIMNGSPAADSPPALLCYDAQVELCSVQEERWIDYHQFHTGYKQTKAGPHELLTHIRLPRKKDQGKTHYHKVGPRSAMAISKVCFAGAVFLNKDKVEDIRLALGSVAPYPLRVVDTEDILRGKKLQPALIQEAIEGLSREITPIDDIRSDKAYRMKVAQNILRYFLEGL